jgi:uncharacterized membrane protein YfcA
MAVLGIFGALTAYFINLQTSDIAFKNIASLLTFLLFIITGISLIKRFPKKSDNLLNIFGLLFFFLIIIVTFYVVNYYNLEPLIEDIISLIAPLYFFNYLGNKIRKIKNRNIQLLILIINLISLASIFPLLMVYQSNPDWMRLLFSGLFLGIFLYIFYPSVKYLFPNVDKFLKKYVLENK